MLSLPEESRSWSSSLRSVQVLPFPYRTLPFTLRSLNADACTSLRPFFCSQFLEETFKRWDLKSYFDFEESVFLNGADETFAPDLPIAGRVAPEDCVPAPIPAQLLERIYSVSSSSKFLHLL